MPDHVEHLGTERIGQLTGGRDPQGRVVINDTESWTVVGIDLGANTEHDGKLVFYFGDVATTDNGEHRWKGWNFVLPNDHQGEPEQLERTGQRDWRYCSRCHSLFWADRGSTAGTACPLGGEHYFHPDSWTFFLPNDHQGDPEQLERTGQRDWRYCGTCRGLFYAPNGDPAGTVCPAGGEHSFPPGSWMFYLPNDRQGATPETGQWDWRYCSKCHSLAWLPPGEMGWRSACPQGNPRNADLVAWTDDPVVTLPSAHGHDEAGWNFVLPNDRQGDHEEVMRKGQRDWRFCGKCLGLFWARDGSTAGTVCPAGGEHSFPPGSWMFFPPNDHQGATPETGQRDWRYCSKCHGMFFAAEGETTGTVCPVNGREHTFHPDSWIFFLPSREHGASLEGGQENWRYCARCHGLFWFGDGRRGVCPALQSGGIRLHPVMRSEGGEFDPLAGEWPVGITKSLEAPGGAFSFDGRAYVFVNISPERWSEQQRPGNPQYGTHLLSKAAPLLPGTHRTEFLFSPRIGACPRDQSGGTLESHQALGYSFVIPHDSHDTEPGERQWRRCTKCAAMFRDRDGNGSGGVCWADSGTHQADSFDYALPLAAGSTTGQRKWQQCRDCHVLFHTGDAHGGRGRCRAGGAHVPFGPELALPHRAEVDNPNRLSQWRYCVKCAGLFWTGGFLVENQDNRCPKDDLPHERMGLDFALQHDIAENAHRQAHWLHCGKCAALFWDGPDGDRRSGVCPRNGTHEAGSATAAPGPDVYDFVLPHDIPADAHSQAGWRFCGKCNGLFWSGHPSGGTCPKGGGGHQAGAGPAAPGYDFVLPHFESPGDDAVRNEGGWRFCARCCELVWTGNSDRLSGVAPRVVKTAQHRFLPATGTQDSLVMTAFGFAPHTGFRLACMPLRPGSAPRLAETRYYTGSNAQGVAQWSADDRQAVDLFTHEGYTSVSTSWLADLGRWLLLYSNAHDGSETTRERPVVARVARTPMEWASADEVVIFNPWEAYGKYMHHPSLDDIDQRIPPAGDEHKGWAYGPHLLDRYTRWDEATRELDVYYLLSLSSPYQVQLMHTKLRVNRAT
ncbi:hypothetical protein [Streptomyces sp. NPDC059593]|uniref:hypothetical protein n=1 Tax=Streptomyces sp. NPDC059593 TaxID=3346878 RepID=UPI0036BD2C7F